MGESYPSLHAELELSHEYADPTKFSDINLAERWMHYEAMQRSGDLVPRALGEVAIIVSRLAFESTQRDEDWLRREYPERQRTTIE